MKTEKIHRGNYEEYFLLYVDNELSAEDIKLLDDFIEINPDLKSELDVLLETKLSSEPIYFTGKDALLKNEVETIEELQLLFLDDELTPDQTITLNAIHQTNTSALASFELLKKTKLPEEKIHYPHKHKLHKRSTSATFLRWLAPVAAAAVLIIIFLIKNTIKEDQQSIPEMVVAENHLDVTKDKLPRITEKETVKTDEVMYEKKPTSTIPVNRNVNPIIEEQNHQSITENIVFREPEIISEQAPELVVPEKITNEVPITVKADFAQDAISETNINEEPEQARKPLRGFIRKASRIYNKVTNPDND